MSYTPITSVGISDGPNLDAFSRLRVSQLTTLADIKNLKDKVPTLVDEVIIGTGTSTYINSSVLMTTSANSDAVIRQTFQRYPYQSGKSHLIFRTFSGFQTQTNITKRSGYFSSSDVSPYTASLDGLWIESSGGVISINVYNSGTATSTVAQSSWNLDKLDGTGASAITIDWSKSQILVLDFQYLGVGRIRWGVDIGGNVIYFHETLNANNTITYPYMASPNQPLRTEIRQTGAGSGSFREICSSINSEGSVNEIGITKTLNNGSTFINAGVVGTSYALLGLRLKAGYLDSIVKLLDYSALSVTNDDFLLQVVRNPTVAGTFTFADVTNSGVQSAIGATAGTNTVTGGVVVSSFYQRQASTNITNIRDAVRMGVSIAGTRDTYVLCVTPLTANMDIYGSLNWFEQL